MKLLTPVLTALLVLSSYAQVKAADAPAVLTAQPKTIDGDAADWAAQRAFQTINSPQGEVAGFQLAYDARFLYAIVRVRKASRFSSSRPQSL